MATIIITFTAVPEDGDSLFIQINPLFPSAGSDTFGFTFGAGQIPIAANINDQAQSLYDALLIHENSEFYEVAWSENVVTLTTFGLIPITDYGVIGDYAGITEPAVLDLTSPYDEYAFTLDNEFYTVETDTDGTYVKFDCSLKVYDFHEETFQIIAFTDKLPLFKKKGKINFGKRIHRAMRHLLEMNTTFFQFAPAELTVTATEKMLSDNTAVSSGELPVQLFIPGLSFGAFTFPKILDINPYPERVTINSKEIISMLLEIGTYFFAIVKNGDVDSFEEVEIETTGVYTKEMLFSEFTQGDTIVFGIYAEDPTGIDVEALAYKGFRIFPITSNFSKQLYWENDFHTMSSLECTGSISTKNDYTSIDFERVVDLVDVLEIIKVKKMTKLFINTGFVMNFDHSKIDSLLRSKRVWLQDNSQTIKLKGQTKSIIPFDGDKGLYSFDLEFLIDKDYDEKNYNF